MGDGEESPLRSVYVDAFYLDRFEVTTARFAKFLEATGAISAPKGWDEAKSAAAQELPVVGVMARGRCVLSLGRQAPADGSGMGACRPGQGSAGLSLGQRVPSATEPGS